MCLCGVHRLIPERVRQPSLKYIIVDALYEITHTCVLRVQMEILSQLAHKNVLKMPTQPSTVALL